MTAIKWTAYSGAAAATAALVLYVLIILVFWVVEQMVYYPALCNALAYIFGGLFIVERLYKGAVWLIKRIW